MLELDETILPMTDQGIDHESHRQHPVANSYIKSKGQMATCCNDS